MKKKKKHSKEKLFSSCKKYKEDLFLPTFDQPFQKENTHSWFDLSATNNSKQSITYDQFSNLFQKKQNSIIVSKKLLFFPTTDQKSTLKQWFKDSTLLFNKTLRLLKSKQFYKTNLVPSFISIRNELKGIVPGQEKQKREKLGTSSIPVHILDGAISLAVEMYKSGLTNWRKKYIKRFRIRYKSYHQDNQILFVEPLYVLKNGNISGIGECYLEDPETKEKYIIKKEEIQKEFKIYWNHKTNQYSFILSVERDVETNNKEKEELISLDPGVCPFLTGVSKTNAYIFGKENYETLRKKLENIDRCNESEISDKKKQKHNERIRRKIKNTINDMHWKTIKWITTNFHNVLIGDMTSKGVVEGNGIQSMSKRILHSQRLFEFKQRLQFKCQERNVNYYEVNEYMTSKTCSWCGNIKEDLGLNKEYDCNNCKKKIHRDINGSRCIYNVWKMNR
jgi:IS605 OrfB family transposase